LAKAQPPEPPDAEPTFPKPELDAETEPVTAASDNKRHRKLTVFLGLAALTLILGLSVDAAALVIRVDRFAIPATASAAEGETWVVVGTDSRAHKPSGRDIYQEGGIPGGVGERADLILVVKITPDQATQVLSIPRDLVLPRSVEGGFERLAAALDQGEPELVNALCQGLGIPTDHLVKVTLRGFVDTVNALGGVTLDLRYSTRDFYSFLEPTGTGTQTLDGDSALSLVRSRHPEYLVGDDWWEASEKDGAAARTANAAVTLSALQQSVRGALANPVKLQRAAWAVAGGFQLDKGTSLWSLTTLARAAGGATARSVPGQATGTELAVLPDDSTFAAVTAAGFVPGSCQVQR
jgi:LCP family protein required for cell wall assembly